MIIKLTLISGKPVFVNFGLVQHFSQRFMDGQYIPGSVITFRDPDTLIEVAEQAEQIYEALSDDAETQEEE